MRRVKGLLWATALVLLSACASDKGPAEQAVKAAETAVAEVRTEAGKWVPDQVRARR
jgi:outer membrane biogenesis lipoprotein LolB